MASDASTYKTMTELAIQSLRMGILTGVYPPGTKLIPAKLESELKLGRVAIREALRELIGSGLIVTVANKGSTVAGWPEPGEIEAMFQIRLSLESQMACLAVAKINRDELEGLKQLHTKMTNQHLLPQGFFVLNREFHMTLYQASGWRNVFRLVNQMMDQELAFRSHFPITQIDYPVFNKDHHLIIKAIQAGQSEEVKGLMMAHLHRSFDYYAKAYREAAPKGEEEALKRNQHEDRVAERDQTG